MVRRYFTDDEGSGYRDTAIDGKNDKIKKNTITFLMQN
jgi:hypothetical protein